MEVSKIPIKRGTMEIVVLLTSALSPQNVVGVLWRYGPTLEPQGKVGEFKPKQSAVKIGSLGAIKNCNFMIEGAVVSQNDDPPTAYQVLVTILQDGVPTHKEVPAEGGAGAVGKEDAPFIYRFQILEAS